MPFNNLNPPFRQQHKIQMCSLVQIVKSLFHVSTHSPKDIHTSVIYWGFIWSPVAWNISGLGLLASTQNDVWSEELHLWKKHHKLCPGFISECILQKKSLNSVLEPLKLNWNTLTHEHTLCLAPWSAPFPLNPAGSPGEAGDRYRQRRKWEKKGFWIERTGHDNFLPRGGGHAWPV